MKIGNVKTALRTACTLLAVATLGATVPTGPLCGDPIASDVQRGTFDKIPLGTQCDTKGSTGPVVSLNVGDAAPIFWIGQLADGICRMTLGTIRDGAFVALARTTREVGDQAPADVGNGQYMSTTTDHAAYVRIDSRARTDALVDLVAGGRVRSLAADDAGHAYAIEIVTGGQGGARLVDLETRVASVLPAATYTRRLERGADGRLYFQQHYVAQPSSEPCALFAVDASGRAVETTTCDLAGDTTVGASGTVWDATELGVSLRDPATQAQTLYAPVYAPPCNNFSPSSSFTHHIVADRRGNAWFVLGSLWHVDRRGDVHAIAIPEHAQVDVATRGLFETADGTLWLFSKKYVEHFTP